MIIEMWTAKLRTARALGLTSEVARIQRIIDRLTAQGWAGVGTN